MVKARTAIPWRREGRLKTGIILAVIGFFLPLLPLSWVTPHNWNYRDGLIGLVLLHPGFFGSGVVLLATGLCLFLTAKATPPERAKVKVIRYTPQHVHLRIVDGTGTREECYERENRPCPFQ
jgi:hypothetical protein